jgi:ketosteroid isomerase-like protein
MDAKENKRLVMEGYEMFQRGDIPRLLERYHDDALWIEPESETVPFAGRHQGKAEIARFFAQLGETTQAMRFEPADFIAEGDKVVVTGEATWQVKATGRTYDSPWVHVFTLRGQLRQRRHQVGEALPLDHHVLAQQARGQLAVAVDDGLHHPSCS